MGGIADELGRREGALRLPHPRAALTWLAQSALAERERWPLFLPAALATGIGLYFALPTEPTWQMAVASAFGAVGAIATIRASHNAALRVVLSLIAAAALGFAVAKVRTELVAAPVLAQQIGPFGLDGRIEQAEPRGNGIRMVLGELRTKRLASAETPARIRVTVRAATPLPAPGSWVHITAVLMPPPAPAAPGAYDFGRSAYFAGLGAVGYIYGRPTAIAPLRDSTLLERASATLERTRNAMTARIRTILPGPQGAIAAALVTGERSSIDPADVDAYRDSGLMHVLSISGLHLALAGGVFFWVLRAILAAFPSVAQNYPIKKWAAVAALAGSTFYLLVSGCEAPAVRSWIMLALMFTAILVDRPAITMRTVAIAAVLLLLIEPESLLEPGFEMSFAAVIGLVAWGEWETRRPPDIIPPGIPRRIWSYLAGIATASIVAGFATAPFVIFHFGRSAQYGILSNLLSLPIAGFVIMPAATAAMVLMPFGLDRIPLLVMGKGVTMMSAVAHWVAGLPGATAQLSVWPLSAMLCVAVGGLWLALWQKTWRWLGVAPIAVGLWLAYTATPPDILVDRDGQAVAIRTPAGDLRLFRKSKDEFAASEWLKRDGETLKPDDAIATPQEGIRCDAYACRAQTAGGQIVSNVLRIEAFGEECATAAVVVSAIPVRKYCKGPQLVIDNRDAVRANGYAVWLTPLRTVTVQDSRGVRPWSASPPPKRQYRRIKPTSLP